jgi:hypothetical protein
MKLSLCPLLLACAGLQLSALGAPITSGSIQITGVIPTGQFSLSGPGFTVTGGFSLGNWAPILCFPCAPGSSLQVTGVQVGDDFAGGTAVIGATSLPTILWDIGSPSNTSNFNVTGPAILLNSGPGTYNGTFSFTGSLCGKVSPGFAGPCDVDLATLSGSGNVAVQIISVGGALQYTSATYNFTTPEPASAEMTLLAFGVLGLIALGRRRLKLFR